MEDWRLRLGRAKAGSIPAPSIIKKENNMKIVINEFYCHPEFGGTEVVQKEFLMAQGAEAQKYYDSIQMGTWYNHKQILIVHEP